MERPPQSVKLVLAAALAIFPAGAAALSFPDLLPGARPAAMGTAYTALSDDVWGIFHNPAGTARAPFTQFGTTLGRHLAPRGDVIYHAWAYTRPFPIRPGSTVGAGFLGLQQAGVGEKNELVLHYAESFTLPRYYITKPFNAGANFKIVQVAPPGMPNKLGLSLDGGLLADIPNDGRLGLAFTDLNSGLGVPSPTLSLGGAWTWDRRVTLAADLRLNPGITQFSPGVEWALFQRLLKLRAGQGFRLDGVSTLALGMGVDYSPLILDFTMNIPSGGWNRNGGATILSAQWRFGAPPFHGRFVGTAARRAEDLRGEIDELERRRKDADSKARSVEADQQSLEGQVRAEEERLRQLQEDSRVLETSVERRRYDLGHPAAPAAPVPALAPIAPAKPAARPAPTRSTSFPLRHLVKAGDTLRRLADLYYGDPSLWERIYDANPDKVERGLPVEGTTLLVPSPKGR